MQLVVEPELVVEPGLVVGPELVMEPGLVVVGPELVVRHGCGVRDGCGVVHAWGQGCMVVHEPRIGSEGRAGCAWHQGWLCMVGLVVHGVRAGCA